MSALIVLIALTLAKNSIATKISNLDFQAQDKNHVKVTVFFESQEHDKKVTDLTLYQRNNSDSEKDKQLGKIEQSEGIYRVSAKMHACNIQDQACKMSEF